MVETADLTDRRGYGLSVGEFARLLYGGPVSESTVAAAVRGSPGLAIVDGVVVRMDRRDAAPRMRLRRHLHRDHAVEGTDLAQDFASRLVSTCPLVRCVALSGSLASGGYDPRDDVDFNLVVRDGSKYTAYLWALALSAVTSVRNIHKETDEMGALPLLPKIICMNVVWEEAQLRPFARQDKWLAYELLMTRPLFGSAFLSQAYRENAWLAEHFPQLHDRRYLPDDTIGEGAVAPRPGAAAFAWISRHPRVLRAVEAASRFAVLGLHAVISLTRQRKPEALAREAFVNTVKRPYSVHDVPGRERPVPQAALDPR